jgi:putative ABC transport system substrate-binding protein
MKRREFITLLGGASVTSPLGVRAQPQTTMRRIAVLLASRDDDLVEQGRLQALQRNLRQLGWIEGINVQFDVRSPSGSAERSREIAADVVARKPDVIVGTGSVVTAALKHATSSIPVVFALVNEPVAQGFVSNLARPGGNITGFTMIDFSVIGKAVELLKAVAPALVRVGLMFDPKIYPLYDSYLRTFQTAPIRSVEVVGATASSIAEIEAAVAALSARSGSGLMVLPDGGFNLANRTTIQAALERHRMPSIVFWRQFVSEGALMSYAPDTVDVYGRVADYIDRILKGAKPAELPVQQPVKFEMLINRKTANALGLDIPANVLALADEVIE